MTVMGNDRVRNYFLANSQEMTPAATCGDVKVLFAPVSDSSEVSGICASILSMAELQQMQRLRDIGLRSRFAQRRVFRRFCAVTAQDSRQPLSEMVFEQTDKGRPFISDAPDLCFSFSSCRFGMLGAWSSSCGIGVDIEDRTQEVEALALARQFFSVAEAKAIEAVASSDRLRAFYQLWSLKEAALKSIGQGLPFGIDAFEFELQPGAQLVAAPEGYGGPAHFCAHEIAQEKVSAALVTHKRVEARP